MKTFIAGMLCLAATALIGQSLRHIEDTKLGAKKGNVENATPLAPAAGPVTVGIHGNEPLITVAPDGTLYISALQHIYRSTNSGADWTELPGPIYASTLNRNSDSSISVDPGNRLYFTFDYPYAGTTAVCTSDDRGDNWSCNPGVVPGGTDRMWVLAPTNSAAYEVTNEGLYQTAFLQSIDRGSTWTAKALGTGILEPQTGPLLQKNCSSHILQIIKVFGTAPTDIPELKLYVYDPASTGSVTAAVRGTGLGLQTALPSAALALDGELWVVTEEPNTAGGRQVALARSFDEGVTWMKLPPIPGTTIGTATFTWVAAGAPGHVGVLYYHTPDNGSDSSLLTTSTWDAVWAESYNADAPTPTWTLTTVESTVHTGAICAAANCMGTDRFAGDFISAIIDKTGVAHLTWMKQEGGTGAISIRYQHIQSGPPSTFTPLPCGLTVASRKTHGSAGPFDISLPLVGAPGIECRSGGANSAYTMVFTFASLLTKVDSVSASATSPNGPQAVSSSGSIGTDQHQYFVNLTGVPNAQYVTVTLNGVHDSLGNVNATVPATMGVLLGDVDASGRVEGNDVSGVQSHTRQSADTTNFRFDVDASGRIDGNDVSTTQAQTRTSLPYLRQHPTSLP